MTKFYNTRPTGEDAGLGHSVLDPASAEPKYPCGCIVPCKQGCWPVIMQQIEAEKADVPSMIPGSKPLPDVTRDGGDFLPGTKWPAEQTPEPPGVFRQDMHTRWTQEAWDAYYSRLNDHGYQPTADEIEAQTAANTWRAEHDHWPKSLADIEYTVTHGSNDTEHLMSSPKNAETLLDSILEARGSRYGAFKDNALVAQQIKHALILGPNFYGLDDDQLEALHQIASKISRIVTGDPDYVDNWDDIAGYAKLVADRLRSEQE